MAKRRIALWISTGAAVFAVAASASGCVAQTIQQRGSKQHRTDQLPQRVADSPRAKAANSAAGSAAGSKTPTATSGVKSTTAQPNNKSTASNRATLKTNASVNPTWTGTLVSLGDSITYGFNLPGAKPNGQHPSPDAYPAQLGQMLHMHVINLGVPRWTTAKLITALHQQSYETSLRQASVVTVDIGSNDLLHAFSGVLTDYLQGQEPASLHPTIQLLQAHIASLPTELTSIIALIRKNTDAPIILTTIYDPAPDHTPMHTFTEPYIARANDIILRTAADKHTLLYDAYGTINHQQWTLVRVMQFDIHPTIAGQRALASGFLSTWQHPVLNRPTRYAITTGGATIYQKATAAAEALGDISGIAGYPIVSQTAHWTKVAWHGGTGYVQRDHIHEIIRYESNAQFKKTTLFCYRITWRLPDGDPVNGFSVSHQFFVPASALAKMVQGHATWDNRKRMVDVNGTPTPALTGQKVRVQPPTNSLMSAITVEYMGIGVRVNGSLIHFTTQPFSYDGSIYVPLDPVWIQLGGQINPLNGRFTGRP